MSTILHQIVSEIGGDVSHGGTRATCPAPGHSPTDRSMSLLLKNDGQVLVNSFSPRTDWQECRRFLEQRGLLQSRSRANPHTGSTSVQPPPASPDPIKLARVHSLWENATPPLKTLAETYLNNRGLKGTHEASTALRYADKCDHRPYGTKYPPFRFSPALLAEISGPTGKRVGLHITYLDPKTGYRREGDPSRKIIGKMMGGAIRLQEATDTLLVAEGTETALSAGRRFETPAWSLISAANMSQWAPPSGIRKLLIAGDSGAAGQEAAFKLAERCNKSNILALPLIVPEEFSDWNEFDTRCG